MVVLDEHINVSTEETEGAYGPGLRAWRQKQLWWAPR